MSDNQTNTLVDALFKVGAHFGFSRSRRHATMKSLVYGSKNRTDIIDLTQTAPMLERALLFVRGLGAEGKRVIFVSGKPEMEGLLKNAASEIDMPYVIGRWIGGTLTNFSQIKKRVKRMQELTEERDTGASAKKYTKKERVLFDREIARLETNFLGISSLEKLPDALIVIDTRHEDIAVAEAKTLNIPIVGIMNSDCDLSLASYPVVGNDASKESVTFFLDRIVEAYREGAAGRVATPEPEEKKV
ncbi:30S ribosomal protein S2 [Patescibacteria group bacterium]|nr:MAG: 30S ribosomal protein S2 [Patescibacteria group bacterium]